MLQALVRGAPLKKTLSGPLHEQKLMQPFVEAAQPKEHDLIIAPGGAEKTSQKS
jgi:hypothetical protein